MPNLPNSLPNYIADDVFLSRGWLPEVISGQKILNGIMDAQLDILRMPWYKVKEEPCPLAPLQ